MLSNRTFALNRFWHAKDAARAAMTQPHLRFHYSALALLWLKRALRYLHQDEATP